MDDSVRSTVGKTDSRRSSIVPNDESVTMYLSFDADDTLSGGTSTKWQSAVVTQSSQFLEIHNSKMEANVDEKNLRRSVLKDLQQIMIGEPEQGSPLRPFNMSILNKHNALSSTPSKDTPVIPSLDLTNVENKENSHADENEHAGGENSTLSSSIDVTANTVKANTLKTVDGTIDEESVQEPPISKPCVSNVYPLSANVVLENITEVSNEGVSMVASPPPEKHEQAQVAEVVNEVTELISKALKISGESIKPQPSKIKVESSKKRMTIAVASAGGMPRPRRSYLPTSSVETRTYSFKQRMSVVVKTTLNSPARKLSAGGSLAVGRRSCLPVAKPKPGGARKSVAVPSSRTSQNFPSKVIKQPTKNMPPVTYNCKTCQATFRVKSLLDMHVRMHDLVENGPKSLKRLNTNTAGAGGNSASGSKNSCKYCDKNFALERALHIHLMQNCSKIPPGEKRKLEFTELNHEKKAQLPKIAASNVMTQPCTLSQRCTQSQQRISMIPSKATTSIEPPMAPPSTKKVPKKAAHAGVYRTPTKTVLCHICKQSFKSILEFTNHSLTVHTKTLTQKPPAGQDHAPSAQD